MAITIEQVRAALEPEELDYNKIAKKLGAEALPHLERLIVGDHPMLASKAAYLAGLIGTDKSVPVLERAARSGDATVRIAAAASVQNLPAESASDLLLSLVDDPDAGVQKVALRAVPNNASAVLRARIEGLSAGKTDNLARSLSREVLSRQTASLSAEPASKPSKKKTGTTKKKASKAKKKAKR
jgi:hypothetical protein